MTAQQPTTFIGRKEELKDLKGMMRMGRPILAVVKGRRRIGKSRLVKEFAKGMEFFSFSGLSPAEKKITAQDQRDEFGKQLSHHLRLPLITFTDWTDAFYFLSNQLTQKPTVILLDEISWMGFDDPTFVPKLKNWWDLVLQKFPHLILIFCGSVSTWIEDNIIKSTAFFGRISLNITLDELSLSESYKFLEKQGIRASLSDYFKILAITGGVPWYLEQIKPDQTIEHNIQRLCFKKNAPLVLEFDQIFNDLFSSRGEIFKQIIQHLSNGMCNQEELRKALKYPRSGSLSSHLESLQTAGFVSTHYNWSLKTGAISLKTLYRLSDNYLRFYLKYIEPNIAKINKNTFKEVSISNLPNWEAIFGLQIENFLLNPINRPQLLKAIGISPQEVSADNPYVQYPTTRQKGCQIDYLIQTHSNTLFPCEIKVWKNTLGTDVIDEMKKKIKRFSRPKGFGICPVLLHLGPISEALEQSRYFYRIIDIGDFLQSSS
jgi:AAA+ ATPase superfamily predicted ATPase